MKLYRFTVASLIFVVAAVLSASLLAGLNAGIAWSAFAISVIPAVLAWRSCAETKNASRVSGMEWVVIALFSLAALRSFCWLIYDSGNQIKILSCYNIGDLPQHINYILYMAHGSRFWPGNPILANSGGIHYPIGVDFMNSLAVCDGVSIFTSLVWAGLLGSLWTCVALFRWGRGFGIAGLIFNGGLTLAVLHAGPQDGIAWKNCFLTLFVTQREFLFALPAGLLLLDSWRCRWNANSERPPLPFWIELCLYAPMPLFHPHTFLFLSLLLGSWVFFANREVRVHVWKLGLSAFIPATFLTILVSDGFAKSEPSFFGWEPGWMQHGRPFFQFWIGNFGIFLPLIVILCILLYTKRKQLESAQKMRAFILPACGVLLLCFFFRLAPWDWDNTKLLLWAYLALLPLLWRHILSPLRLELRALFCVLLFAGGAVSLGIGLNPPDNGYEVASRPEVDAVSYAIRNIPMSERFAAASDYAHPLVLLGRKIAVGYAGHLFGHGLPYQKQKVELDTLMDGRKGWREAAAQLKCNYLFWGKREDSAWPDSTQPWKKDCRQIARGPWGAIYQLNEPSASR